MATKEFQEIVCETEKIVGNIGLFIVEEQCRKIGASSQTLTRKDEPRLLMEILVIASRVTTLENWRKLEKVFKRRMSGIK